MVALRNRTDGQVEQDQPQAVIDAYMRNFIIYGVEGLVMTFTNLLIILTVMRFKGLREQKELIIVVGLAFADGLNGFAFLASGIGRVNQLLNGDAFVLKSRWHCGTTIWNICWTFANNMAGLMLLVISIDRLLAVSFPLRYFTFTKRYAYLLVGLAYTYICIPATVSFILSYQYQKPENPAYCLVGMGMNDGYYKYFVMFHLVTSFSSVLLYGPVIFMLRKTLRISVAATDASKMARLVKVTTTLGIHTIFTFLFNMIPDLLILYSHVSDQTPYYMMLNVNAMVNIFIYTLRFKDLRKGLKALITCQDKIPVIAVSNVISIQTSRRSRTRSLMVSSSNKY